MDWLILKENIYDIDDGLRDIIIINTTEDDWKLLIEYVNKTFPVVWLNFKLNTEHKSINFPSVLEYWNNTSKVSIGSLAYILLDNFKLHIHFFTKEKIEISFDPHDVNSISDHNAIVNFIKNISQLLHKNATLIVENCPEIILMKVEDNSVIIYPDKNNQNIDYKN